MRACVLQDFTDQVDSFDGSEEVKDRAQLLDRLGPHAARSMMQLMMRLAGDNVGTCLVPGYAAYAAVPPAVATCCITCHVMLLPSTAKATQLDFDTHSRCARRAALV